MTPTQMIQTFRQMYLFTLGCCATHAAYNSRQARTIIAALDPRRISRLGEAGEHVRACPGASLAQAQEGRVRGPDLVEGGEAEFGRCGPGEGGLDLG